MVTKKIVTDPITLRNNGIRIAYQMWKDGFIPSMIYVPLRGGAGLGNIISEVFKLLLPEAPSMYCAVVAHSYQGFGSQSSINIDGWTTTPENIRPVDRVLLVDDIYDSGKSANYLWDLILKYNKHPENFRLAVHDYKEFTYREPLPKVPDYWAVHHRIENEEDDFWIHYSSHELYGLTMEERQEHYYKDDPTLQNIMEEIFRCGGSRSSPI
ncbi:phosphoribosyltransferase family protein [Candidatus Haliotispira prima]|uniref:Phosphoribosyltransferase family protein n=1 Tax=Candidatus Haliotispira prima TaxID=3034016 RepID=A0ABY8MI57_9SPIO|nr:phosphoribosyltransferase family protein [Candidatus Haliotispira prima]